MVKIPKGLRGSEAQAQTRLLLILWDLGGTKEEVNRQILTAQTRLNQERVMDYKDIFEKLTADGAIAVKKANRSEHISLTDKGLQMLSEGLKKPEFEFDGKEVKVRDKDANALLKWIRATENLNGAASTFAEQANGKAGSSTASYEEFKQVALVVYDQLNQDYNLNNLVPIYRIRREIGDRVTRSQFNEWLLEMQASDIFQLMAGEMRDITSDKHQDSITIPGGGLRYYAKRLNS